MCISEVVVALLPGANSPCTARGSDGQKDHRRGFRSDAFLSPILRVLRLTSVGERDENSGKVRTRKLRTSLIFVGN